MTRTQKDLLFSSSVTNYSTPQYLFDEWDIKYHFTLDAAADKSNHKCKTYFTEADDGLSRDWSDFTVWLNPPYGRGLGKWVEKAFSENQKGTAVVMLVPARTDTAWFHKYVYKNPNCKITFLKGRLKFSGNKNSAPFPSMIIEFTRPSGVFFTTDSISYVCAKEDVYYTILEEDDQIRIILPKDCMEHSFIATDLEMNVSFPVTSEPCLYKGDVHQSWIVSKEAAHFGPVVKWLKRNGRQMYEATPKRAYALCEAEG